MLSMSSSMVARSLAEVFVSRWLFEPVTDSEARADSGLLVCV